MSINNEEKIGGLKNAGVDWEPKWFCDGTKLDLTVYPVICPDGRLRTVLHTRFILDVENIKCLTSRTIPESDFLVCVGLRDLKTRKPPRIIYQLPCR